VTARGRDPQGGTVTSRIFSAVLAGQMLLLTGCTGGPSSASPSVEGLPTPTSANPTESTPPSADPTEPGPDPSATPSDPEEQVLLDRVREEGTLSVIIEVALAGTAALNSHEKRRLVAEAQDDLIAELDPAHMSVQTRFRNTAQLTLTVDEEGLRALFASPRVTRVRENESIPLE
jgi:hypothetical protein